MESKDAAVTSAEAEVNPVLVVIAWLVALGGESTEKCWVQRRASRPEEPTE